MSSDAAHRSPESADADAPPALGRRRALVVEDEPLFQSLVTDAFAMLPGDWEVVHAETGGEALGAIRAHGEALDLVLVDLGLPDISGVEVIRLARQTQAAMPILVLSVRSDESHVLGAVRAGALGYLLKDEPALTIADAITKAMAGEYPISPSLARHLFKLATQQEAFVAPEDRIHLPPKELELIRLLAKGCSYKKAALLMDVSLSTIQTYVRRIYQRLDANSKVEAVEKARRQGLLC